MRITSGKFKSRLIKMPQGIRPTQDKVRKALFDILADVEGLSFLELFAGSGAVGLEAASRGARELTLVEDNRKCILAIKQNIDALKLKSCSLCALKTEKAVELFYKDKRSFDIIFLDPPYYQDSALRLRSVPRASETESLAKKTLQMLGAYDILAPYGLVVVQHFKKVELPKTDGNLTLVKEARYGDTLLSFYKKKER